MTTPKLPLPALRCPATGGHACPRAGCDTKVASPEPDALCPHCPAFGDTAGRHPGRGPRAGDVGVASPELGALSPTGHPWGQSPPSGRAHQPSPATSPALLAVRVVPGGHHGGHSHGTHRAQAVQVTPEGRQSPGCACALREGWTQHPQLCFLLPASFPRPGNAFSSGMTLPSLSPSSGPCTQPITGSPSLGVQEPWDHWGEQTSPGAALLPATLSLKPARLFQKYLYQRAIQAASWRRQTHKPAGDEPHGGLAPSLSQAARPCWRG